MCENGSLQEKSIQVFTLPPVACDWLCITTNAMINRSGRAAMGRGIALAAKRAVRNCDFTLGRMLAQKGNHVYQFASWHNIRLFAFPTKTDWKLPSSLSLIEQSCQELRDLWDASLPKPRVFLPRPGCCNGGLNYEHQVRPLLLQYFGHVPYRDFFTIIDLPQ